MNHSTTEIFAYVLLDIAVIIVIARVFGRAARALGQPAVVGEIVAGIALGPSLLGALPGDLDSRLFPADVVPYLQILAQLGLVLFMFIVGLELDIALIRGRGRLAGGVSLASIVAPFALGAGATLILHPLHDEVDGEPVPLFELMLFMGVAMSITAFPVLARILTDRGMHRTTIGVLALAAAAVDDVVAWTLLAFVVAVVEGGSPLEVVRIVALTAAFAAVVLLIVRPLLRRLLDVYRRVGRLTPDILAVILVGVLVSAYITEQIGIHAIFGAFLFGTALPRAGAEAMTQEILERLEQVSMLLLLPIFFVVTGFGVDILGLSGSGWLQLLLVLAVAVVGKFGGAFVGARAQRLPRQSSAALGVLMNTRGLTELVILTIGVKLGILDQELFTMMVLMALITTAMAAPLLRVIYPDKAIERDIELAARSELGSEAAFRVFLVLDGPPDPNTEALLRIARLAAGGAATSEIVLTRFLPAPDADPRGVELGAGPLPDLAAMARAVEELEHYARAGPSGPGRVRVMCRFSASQALDLQRQVHAAAADVVVTERDWAERYRQELAGFEGVVILVLAQGRADPASGAAVAVDEQSIYVCDDGSADGSRAVLLGVRAALASGKRLVAVPIGSSRIGRRLSYALQGLRRYDVDISFAPDSPSLPSPCARVSDQLAGSEVNLREEVDRLATDHAGSRK
ncbi:cation:proton antiporter [Aldersonia kunmingensis]|uniref:cation:proton antiporter n=1 Tax=Aldersonia kunmingensis TaxID=408066 RepID=UPI000831F98F|nr:cation:proton antiporter [Aldersonia kunmingensis]